MKKTIKNDYNDARVSNKQVSLKSYNCKENDHEKDDDARHRYISSIVILCKENSKE